MEQITVKLPHKEYNIYIKKGLLNILPKTIKENFNFSKLVIITDDNVKSLYGDKLVKSFIDIGINTFCISVLPGEVSKSIRVAEKIYKDLLKYKINKGDLVIALGGGVVGDLTGFVCATFLRGIPFIQIPTTILSQVDSSVGGKTAVNLEEGKNLVGAFYHPEAVFIDPDVLETLEEKYISDGMAEVIKYGCISDTKLFEILYEAGDYNNLRTRINEIIYRCIDIKREIVEQDEKESGIRMLLNFGHTIGHAIEKYYNYNKYTHGQAVAIGMYYITESSERLGKTKKNTSQKVKEVIQMYKLPYKIEKINKDKIIDTIKLDKKTRGNKINIILLKEIGESLIETIDMLDLKKYI